MKCLIELYINFTSEFVHGHGPLNALSGVSLGHKCNRQTGDSWTTDRPD